MPTNPRNLSRDTVITIKRSLIAGDSHGTIAARHGISKRRVSSIATERTYADFQLEEFTMWKQSTRQLPGEPMARQIMDLLYQTPMTQGQIARHVGCSQSTVSEIARGITWTQLDHPWVRFIKAR